MNKVELQELVGGALQEKFAKSFERVVDNLQDVNTPYKVKRKITVQLDFTQNENRDDVHCAIAVVEKLAPQAPLSTSFAIGKDLKTGEVYAAEYGKQIKGQMTLSDFEQPEPVATIETVDGEVVDTSTGEVIDFRKAVVM